MNDPWIENEDGFWCPACGYPIAPSWFSPAVHDMPETCKQCGFPDFEDGPGYFTDGDE